MKLKEHQVVVVDGDNTATEQYNYNDAVQDQTGFEGSVQDQDSASAVEQGAAVTGEDNTASQDAENISEQIQIGDAGSDQYQGSTNDTNQVTNQNGA